jgi:ceramide glucosyltransferase
LEPQLYECIASTFRQDYPVEKVQIRLCVDDYSDPAYPVLQKLVTDFPQFDAKVMVESETASTEYMKSLGPNPKIRNISRSYREASGEVIWIIDCNVWAASGVLGRMIDKLMGYTKGDRAAQPYKFTHQLPLLVDCVDYNSAQTGETQSLADGASAESLPKTDSLLQRIWSQGGGRLDELFMATTHAKFYGAINSVGVAPCVVGKSNMFRKAHLDQVTDPSQNPIIPKHLNRPTGVDYFSHNICEDHSIGELIWNTKIPGYGNHGILWGDLVIQPMAGMSVAAYAARRVRWLRARKYTVLAATLVEPGVESLLCGVYFSLAVTTLPWFEVTLGIPQTWSAMGIIWLVFVTSWMLADWNFFCRLHSAKTFDADDANMPFFAKGPKGPVKVTSRAFHEWLPAWIGREVMALPIWTWAVLLGHTVNWRGKVFRVHSDTTVSAILPNSSDNLSRMTRTPELERQSQANKHRRD